MKNYYVYILASRKNGVLYTGVTSNLITRIEQHKSCAATKSFTSKYNVHRLVFYEMHSDIHEAIRREKNIKAWNRAWKISLVEKNNPKWIDLFWIIAV